MNRAAHLILALTFLSGCASTPEPKTRIVTVREPARTYAPECTAMDDPTWDILPDRDVRRAEGARNYRINRQKFATLERRRAACRASHKAHERRL